VSPRSTLPMLLVSVLFAAGASHAVSAQAAAHSAYSSSSLYNLGNAYARAGMPGMAVLNYERATLLDPVDPDIRANLQHVRETAGLPAEPRSVVDRLATLASPHTLSWVGLGGLLVAGLSLLVSRVTERHRIALGTTAFLAILLCGVTVCSAIATWPLLHGAVVLTAAAPVRVSPVPMGEPLFTVREAEIVTTSAHHDSYVLIQTHSGRRGWMSSENLAMIAPVSE
jgi:hypothetical protein